MHPYAVVRIHAQAVPVVPDRKVYVANLFEAVRERQVAITGEVLLRQHVAVLEKAPVDLMIIVPIHVAILQVIVAALVPAAVIRVEVVAHHAQAVVVAEALVEAVVAAVGDRCNMNLKSSKQ